MKCKGETGHVYMFASSSAFNACKGMPYWIITDSLAIINGLHEGSLKIGLVIS
jgi:hypothetical protein